MKIETKFELNQMVYPIYRDIKTSGSTTTKYMVARPNKIARIDIALSSVMQGPLVIYTVNGRKFTENNLFLTEEEAKLGCSAPRANRRMNYYTQPGRLPNNL